MASPNRIVNGVCRLMFVVLLNLGGCRGQSDPETKPRASSTNPESLAWLDQDPAENSATARWMEEQTARTRQWLTALPDRSWIEARLQQLVTNTAPSYRAVTWRHGRFFALKWTSTDAGPRLVTWTSDNPANDETVLVPTAQSTWPAGSRLRSFAASPDGQNVVVVWASHASAWGEAALVETRSGSLAPKRWPRVHSPLRGGSVVWDPTGAGFYYTRYPGTDDPRTARETRPQVHWHRLGGDLTEDLPESEGPWPLGSTCQLGVSSDGEHLLVSVGRAETSEQAHTLRRRGAGWHTVSTFGDQVSTAAFGRDPLYLEWPRDQGLYLLSFRDAPRGKILRLPLTDPDKQHASTVLEESAQSIETFQTAASGLYLSLGNGEQSELAMFDFTKRELKRSPAPDDAAVQELSVFFGDAVWFRHAGYLDPPAWYRFDPNTHPQRIDLLPLSPANPAPFSDVEVLTLRVSTADAPDLRLRLLQKKGTALDGNNPTLLCVGDRSDESWKPDFHPEWRWWLDQGGLIVLPSTKLSRSGDTAKDKDDRVASAPRSFPALDVIRSAEYLIRSNYTRASRLAVAELHSSSHAVFQALIARPDLFRAAVVREPQSIDPAPSPDPAAPLARSPFPPLRFPGDHPSVLVLGRPIDLPSDGRSLRRTTALLQAGARTDHPVLFHTAALESREPSLDPWSMLREWIDLSAFLAARLGVTHSLIDRGPLSGAVTATSAVVKTKLLHESLPVELLVSTEASLERAQRFLPVPRREADPANGLVEFHLDHLRPDTRYFYGFEVAGRRQLQKTGQLRTFPNPGPASFTFAFASCARTGSTSDVFATIQQAQPLFFLHLGDLHYLNIQTNDRARFLAAYDAVLASPQQAALFRQVPLNYVWDDHDFGGNNSNRKASSYEAARSAYDIYVPHYPLPLAFAPGGGPIGHAFTVGRVRFLVTELRSERDDIRKKDSPQKTLMGPEQKKWFKEQLRQARGRFPLICWVSPVPWIGLAGTNVYRDIGTNQYGLIRLADLPDAAGQTNTNRTASVDDHWGLYATERREIADFIKEHRISGVCILHGDSHMVAADDGTHSDYATGGGAPIPVLCAGPLDQASSIKGGPYSQGVYRFRSGEGGFGLVRVTDRGSAIDVAFSGRHQQGHEIITLQFSVPATPIDSR